MLLKQIIKNNNLSLEIPSFPKKNLFHFREEQEIVERRLGLDLYFKKLVNDYTIFNEGELKESIF
jgi:hypothetical protein